MTNNCNFSGIEDEDDEYVERIKQAYDEFYTAWGYISRNKGLLSFDQAVERLRHDLMKHYPEDEKQINKVIDFFTGYDPSIYYDANKELKKEEKKEIEVTVKENQKRKGEKGKEDEE